MTASSPSPGTGRATKGRSALETLARAHADATQTRAQIGVARLGRLGARDFVHDDEHGALWFRAGGSRPHRVVLVVLRADDTYAIEVGRVVAGSRRPRWISDATLGVDQGLYADQLGDLVEQLFVQVTG